MVGLILEEARRIYFAHAAGAFPWIAKRETLFVGAFAVNEVVHSFRPFVIHDLPRRGGGLADALCDFVQRLFLISEITRIVSGVDELRGTVLVRFKGKPFPRFNFAVAVLRGSEKVEIQGVPLVIG